MRLQNVNYNVPTKYVCWLVVCMRAFLYDDIVSLYSNAASDKNLARFFDVMGVIKSGGG
jgi:hypothetical protein